MALRSRIIATADGMLRASKEGHDVLTASLDEMAFDERFAFVGLAVDGTKRLAPRKGVTQPGVSSFNFDGRVFDHPPFFFFGWTLSSDRRDFIPPYVTNLNNQPGSMRVVEAEIKQASVTFKNWYYGGDGTVTVRYKALV